MATENQAQQTAMEDILSSIRTGVEEEGSKVGTGSADLIDAAAASDGDEDDILELSATDMVAAPAAVNETEELIDIAAFAVSGAETPAEPTNMADLAADLLGEGGAKPVEAPVVAAPAAAPAEGGAADEFDRLLAEISQEQQQNVVASEVTKQALMSEEEPLGEDAATPFQAPIEAPAPDLSAPVATTLASVPTNGHASYSLSAVEGTGGMQVAFPAEVLAMALRPMVQDWLSQNLPGIVEKLVKEEISKLTQN